MLHFIEHFHSGKFLHRGEFFSIFNFMHLEEVKGLFKLFYYAKDFETFKQVVVWARIHMNEGLFVYALNMVAIHHADYKFIVIPALYEILPHMFYNGKFIMTVNAFEFELNDIEHKVEQKYLDYLKNHVHEAEHDHHKKWKHWVGLDKSKFFHDMNIMEMSDKKIFSDHMDVYNKDPHYVEMMKDIKMYWLKHETTDHFGVLNDEAKLNYLTEDFDWNMYWYYSHMRFPFWLDSEEFGFKKEHFGEYFLFNLQQLLARYHLERLSNNMGHCDAFHWEKEVKHGYNPHLVTYGYESFTMRPNFWEMDFDDDNFWMDKIEDFERRIRDVVDRGVYHAANGEKIDLRNPEGIDYVGKMFMGHHDVLDKYFFGNWMLFTNVILSGNEHMGHEYHIHNPHVFLNFETMLRDPLFYEVYKKIMNVYYSFKYHLKPYKHEDLHYKGVSVNDVTHDKFITYYDFVDAEVSSLVDYNLFFKDGKFNWDSMFLGRRMRLNHKPFTMTYDINADVAGKAIIRTFLGPKFDEYGHVMTMNSASKYYVLMDSFPVDLVAGNNIIKHNSLDYFWTRRDRSTYTELYRNVMMTLDGKMELKHEYDMVKVCGFPDHLLLPKGWYNGMPMKLFVMVSPFDSTYKQYSVEEYKFDCGSQHMDKHVYGYPLDRHIVDHDFFVPNMFWKDDMIFHTDNKEVVSVMGDFMEPKYHY